MIGRSFLPPALRGRKKKKPLLTDAPPPKPAEAERGRPRLERSEAMKPKRIGEVAGGAAAECAAVCCCCPCTVMNIVVMAVYKVPASLCRKAKKRQQRLRRKKQGLPTSTSEEADSGGSREELEREVRAVVERGKAAEEAEAEAVDLEKEMWDRFHDTGFWRSPSLRDT